MATEHRVCTDFTVSIVPPVLPHLPSLSHAPLRLVGPLGFIESDVGGGGGGGVDLAGKAITAIGASIILAFQGVRELLNQTQGHKPSETTILERPRSCGVAETAGAYLANLQRDAMDQSLRSIPPRTYEWKLPTGHSVEVRQTLGKDGLTFEVDLKEPQGKRYRLQSIRAEVNEKGVKVPVGKLPLRVGDRFLGELDLALRVGATGLNEVTLTHTGTDGKVLTLKLKTTPCDPDFVDAKMLRTNIGSSGDARHWAEAHLARSARARGGVLHEGLTDLLMQIRPSANGIYRNHGSAALELLSRPLELLRKSGADLAGLQSLQREYAQLPRHNDGRPVDAAAFRTLRQRAWGWLQHSVKEGIARGQFGPKDLVNRFGVNYGLDAVRSAGAPASAVRTQNPSPASPSRPYAAGEGIGTPYGRALWSGLTAAGDGIVKTRTTTYSVPAQSVDLRSRDAVRAWVQRSVERGHIQADHLYGASQARYLDGERIGTPHGDLFFDAADGHGAGQVRGRDKNYRIKQGVDLDNRDAVRAWAIRAIEQGQIDRAQLFSPTPASTAEQGKPAWPLKVKAQMRVLQQSARRMGWDLTQLADGRLFIWRVAGQSAAADVTRAIATTLAVPLDRITAAPLSHSVLGQSRTGLAMSARVYRD